MSVPLQVAALFLKGLDLLAWIVSFGPLWMVVAQGKVQAIRAKEVSRANVNGDLPPSAVFRSVNSIEKGELMTRPFPEVGTMYDMVARAVRKYGPQRSLGTRQLLEVKTEEGQRFPTKVFGQTEWRTYKQVGEQAHDFGSGLRALGMVPMHLAEGAPCESVEGGHTVLMYEDTCAEWFIGACGAFSQSLVVATAYATLGVEAVMHAVNEAGVSTIVCNYNAVKAVLAKKSEMPTLKTIVYTTLNVPPATKSTHPGQGDSEVQVLSFEEVVAKGREAAYPPTPPQPQDIAILMYTSGSTGNPKGVVVRHSQIVCLLEAIKSKANLREGETLVGYLPLAHIFEMQMEFFAFGYGGEIGYADPKTLVAGPGKCEPVGALKHFRPTIMGAVPKVWEVIKTGAEAKVAAGGAAKEFLFKQALEWKKTAMPQYRATPVFDKLVFSKIQDTLGGRLRVAVSGGGAISAPVQEWVRTVFGCPLIQGYGLTETCAGLTVQSQDDWRCGVVGSPIDTVETLLHSEPELHDFDGKAYLATDTDHYGEPCLGRGEVWVRGSNITDGYYKLGKDTAEAFDKDGWFHTGDVAVMLTDGTLKIVDRKKNLVKLKGGEYIALERMNLAFAACEYVDTDAGGVCSYGDSEMDRPIALVQVKHAALIKLAQSIGMNSINIEQIVKEPQVEAAVVKALNAAGKASVPPLTSLETLAGAALITKPWSADDGTLTASLKIVPKKIQIAHAAELAAAKAKGIR